MDAEVRREYNSRYYREHLEERRAYGRAYYALRKKRLLSLHPDDYYKEVAQRSASSKASRERNMALYAEKQRVIRDARQARGWLQKDLAEKLGVTQACVRYYECGAVKAPWDKLTAVMPELQEVKHEHYI
jgi:ribosome-binding protein aMBF1 (putative translation factor)